MESGSASSNIPKKSTLGMFQQESSLIPLDLSLNYRSHLGFFLLFPPECIPRANFSMENREGRPVLASQDHFSHLEMREKILRWGHFEGKSTKNGKILRKRNLLLLRQVGAVPGEVPFSMDFSWNFP